MTRNRNNQLVVPHARAALNRMKVEIAQEHGIAFTPDGYNGNLVTRDAGTIGGNITKRLVEIAEQTLDGRRRF
ncbi:alpha/beta-type small acid-soluble spore protein [Paenibacillus xylaniclasticus]|uniref:alpha/beta-type small acid-soluble spore protein n=1 Tax=Paenibacillus xylaniclasticus TaxID=588083 RepID=UPI000FD8C0FA|nr:MULTISPECIES: alpha/beta-type small acid-soluble spore protein [Paenibacillus]GFN30805.1 hypothetical protein PCURB6_10650 [Paenibacillus curdlanolyticus]